MLTLIAICDAHHTQFLKYRNDECLVAVYLCYLAIASIASCAHLGTHLVGETGIACHLQFLCYILPSTYTWYCGMEGYINIAQILAHLRYCHACTFCSEFAV